MTIAVDLERKATKQTKNNDMSRTMDRAQSLMAKIISLDIGEASLLAVNASF